MNQKACQYICKGGCLRKTTRLWNSSFIAEHTQISVINKTAASVLYVFRGSSASDLNPAHKKILFEVTEKGYIMKQSVAGVYQGQ